MKKLILHIDTDPALHSWLKETLPQTLFLLESANNGREGVEMAFQRKPDLILMDWNLPGWSGAEVCKYLKANKECAHIPLIIVSHNALTHNKVAAFNLGADDYLTKPFEIEELIARIKAVLRRFGTAPDDIIQAAGISLNLTAYSAEVGGKALRLTRTEMNLLHMLMKNPGRILTRKQLLERVWGYSADISTRTVDVYIRRLRKKLGPQRASTIESINRFGYKFKGPLTSTPPVFPLEPLRRTRRTVMAWNPDLTPTFS